MGSSFVLFDVSMEITLGQFRSGKSGYTQKMSFPVGKRYLPMGKRASVTTTIIRILVVTHYTWTTQTRCQCHEKSRQ